MKAEILEQKIEKVSGESAHVSALLLALGNPSEWAYTGEVIDAGNSEAACACGHPIRYCFLITHPTRGMTQVGSTCIDHIAGITPLLGERLIAAREALEKELAECKIKAKHAAADSENEQLWKEFIVARDIARFAHKNNRDHGVRSPRELWYFCEGWKEGYNRNSPPKYSRRGDLKKWIIRAIVRAKSVIQDQ